MESEKLDGAAILERMAETYRDRGKKYGDNFKLVGKVMMVWFPNGLHLKTEDDFIRFHLLDFMLGKLARFAVTNMEHVDSVHDLGPYAAITEMYLRETGRE